MSDNSVTQEEIKALNTAKPYEFDYHVSNSQSSKERLIDDVMQIVNESSLGMLSLDGAACRRVAVAVIASGYKK